MNWLMLRGLAREQRHWGGFPRIFEETVDGESAHLLDLPGAGTEWRRASPATVRGMASDLRGRWLSLAENHDGPWALLGISLGGMVAMQWCHDHPADFERLVVINSSARNFAHPLRRMSPSVVAGIARALAEKDPVARERRVLGFTTRLASAEELDSFANDSAGWLEERPITVLTLLTQMAAAARFKAPERLGLPVLFLAGGRDPLADPSCAWAMARHYGAALHVHPSAGHDISTDDPRWLALQIRTWLESTGAAGPGARAQLGT